MLMKIFKIVGGQHGLDRVNRIKELEQEVARSNEVGLRLQRELAEANAKLSAGSTTSTTPANQRRSNSNPADGVRHSINNNIILYHNFSKFFFQ